MKATLIKTTLASAVLLAASPAAFATSNSCSGADCVSDIRAEVSLSTDFYVDADSKGVFIQNNSGDIFAGTKLTNLVIRNDGALNVETQAIGNNLSIDMKDSGPVEVKFISQSNKGEVTAVTEVTQRSTSRPGEVTLNATAVGNNLSIITAGSTLSAGLAQCNTADVTAVVSFKHDPLSMSATATAVGNSINIAGVRTN